MPWLQPWTLSPERTDFPSEEPPFSSDDVDQAHDRGISRTWQMWSSGRTGILNKETEATAHFQRHTQKQSWVVIQGCHLSHR